MSVTWQPGQTIADIEKDIIYFALKHFENNKTKTASALGISIRTIDNKLAKYEGRGKKKKDDDSIRADRNAEENPTRDGDPNGGEGWSL